MINLQPLTTLDPYCKPAMAGDRWAREILDFYRSEIKKIRKYKGKSKVNVRRMGFYEPLLISQSWKWWWHFADNSFIRNVIWFFRRLKVGLSPKQEWNLLNQFYSRLPMHRQMLDMGAITKSKELYEYFQRHGVDTEAGLPEWLIKARQEHREKCNDK